MRAPVLVLLLVALCLPAAPGLAFEGIRLTLLGTGAPDLPAAGPGPGILVEAGDEKLLVDCGPGTEERLRQAGVPVRELTAVFLSTLDPVRLEGCRDLMRVRVAVAADQPLLFWGPAGAAAFVRELESDLGAAPQSTALGFDIVDNVVYQPQSATVTAFVTADAGAGQSYGYRIESANRAVALSGSTRYSDNLIRYARGAHVLVHEVAAASEAAAASADAQRLLAAHTSPEEAARVFRAARPYLAVYSQILLLDVSEDELVRRTRNLYRGPLQVGRALLVIEVQNEVQVRAAPSDPR
jgi:ribonuclease Z